MGKYIGRETPYGMFDTQDLVFGTGQTNGATTSFTLNYKVANAASILVVYGSQVLKPETGYTITDGGTKIAFSTFTPANGISLYIVYLGKELLVGPNAISVPTGDKGDITVSTTSTPGDTWTIDAGAVTPTKIGGISSGSLLGRSSTGTGVVEQISLSTTDFVLSGTTLNAIKTFPIGSVSAPSIAFTSHLSTGIYTTGADHLSVSIQGTGRAHISTNGITLGNQPFTSSNPVGGTLNATDGGGTNIAGANLTIRGGASTGTAAGGTIIFQTSSASGVSGTATNTPQTRMQITSLGEIVAGVGSVLTGSRFIFDLGATSSYRIRGDSESRLLLEDTGASDVSRPFQYLVSDGGNFIIGNANRSGTGTTSSVDRLRIDSSGNITVNASAITTTISVGSKVLQIQDGNNAGPELVLYNQAANDSALSHITFGGIRTNVGASARISANRLGVIIFGNNDAANGVNTVIERARITSDGNFYIGNGDISATPSNGVLRATNATGTNIAGAPLDIMAGGSTGSAVGGAIRLFTSTSGTSGATANTLTERARVKPTGQLRFVPLSADPAGAEAGDVYYNSTTNKLRVYNGTAWVDLH